MPLTISSLTLPQGEIAVCQTAGTGLPVVMLHGLGASKDVFTRQLESPLGELHRLIAFDLPGHGASSDARDPQAGYTLSAVAYVAAAVLDRLSVPRAVVFGWSLGGHVAIEMMARRPDLVAGMMLTGVPPGWRGRLGSLRAFHFSREMLLAAKETYTDRDTERFERLCFGPDADGSHGAMIQRTDGRMRPILNRSLWDAAPGQRQVVEQSAVPVAMVNGADEPVVRLGYVAAGRYRNLWEGMTHVLPNAGHAPFVNTPNAFNALLHRFVTYVAVREQQKPAGAPNVEIARSA